MKPGEIAAVIAAKLEYAEKIGSPEYFSTESAALLGLHDIVAAFLDAIEASPAVMKEMSVNQLDSLNKLYMAVGK